MNALLGSDVLFLLLPPALLGWALPVPRKGRLSLAGRWQRAGRSARSHRSPPAGCCRSRRCGPPALGDLLAGLAEPATTDRALHRPGAHQEHTRSAEANTRGRHPRACETRSEPLAFCCGLVRRQPGRTHCRHRPEPAKRRSASRPDPVAHSSRDEASSGFARGSCPAGPASQPRPCRRRTPEPPARARRRMGRPHAKSGAFGRCRGPRR